VGSEKYAFQQSYKKYNTSSTVYSFAVISDMDKLSKVPNEQLWMGIMKEGSLVRNNDGKYSLVWGTSHKLISQYNEGGLGMELSELVFYDDKLLTCDDRTGIIFEIERESEKNIVFPVHILANGNGRKEKGFKCEWMTVKDDTLIVGSMGKEFAKDGKIVNMDSTWVKVIDGEGRLRHIAWNDKFQILRKHAGAEFPGYLLHESAGFNPVKREWVFLPRRFSKDPYDEKEDESKGTNMLLIVSEDFSQVRQYTVGMLDPLRGVSSFKFIPFRESEVIALKTIEHQDRVESFVTVYNLVTQEVLMEDQKIDDVKFEGVEFL